jgi:hypothetical protein
MPPKAYRWVAEMHEIGHTTGDRFAGEMYAAFADFYGAIARRRTDAARAETPR